MNVSSVNAEHSPARLRDPVRIILVDDNVEFLEVAAQFLSEHHELVIVARAGSGCEAVQLARELAPDLVVMDLSMPEMNGLEAARKIKARTPAPHVIILTLYEDCEFRAVSLAAGADDFLNKSEFGDSLLPLIARLFPGHPIQLHASHECV